MRVYLAASFKEKERMRLIRDKLVSQGYTVTSRWIDSLFTGLEQFGTSELKAEGSRRAMMDWYDIRSSDFVVVFTETPSTTGGLYVEYGLALASHKLVVIVGPILNVFMCPEWALLLEGEEQLFAYMDQVAKEVENGKYPAHPTYGFSQDSEAGTRESL